MIPSHYIPTSMYQCLLYGFIYFLFFSFNAGGQTAHTQEPVIAKAGNAFITEREYLQRYELLPYQYRNRPSNIEESKLVFLYSLIAEKLLAQDAESRHLDQDTAFQQAFDQIKKNFARDQLYREQIQAKVAVTKAEVRNAITDAERQHRCILCAQTAEDVQRVLSFSSRHYDGIIEGYRHVDLGRGRSSNRTGGISFKERRLLTGRYHDVGVFYPASGKRMAEFLFHFNAATSRV
jgi:hypothetical protein